MQIKKEIWHFLSIAAIVTSAACIIALCFFEWQSPNVYSQGLAVVISATLGAILTALITSMVIDSQLKQEQKKEEDVKIYEQKLRVYSQFVAEMWSLYNDGKIDKDDILRLRSKMFNELIFLLKEDDFNELTERIEKLRDSSKNELEEERVTQLLGQISYILRKDLNISDVSKENNPMVPLWNAFIDNQNTDDDIQDCVLDEASQIGTGPSTTTRKYWHMNMLDYSIQRRALKEHKYELSLVEWKTAKRTNILRQVKKGDIIFLYNGGNNFLGVFEAIGRRIIFRTDNQLKEEVIPNLEYPTNKEVITGDQLKDDIANYDFYGGINDGADYCSNLIVNPLACMLIHRDHESVYRRTISSYDAAYGVSILKKYKEALESNNPKFGKIDEEEIKCDTQTFLSLF